ncbi:hypothetical protein [Oryzihumus leptocrescens]|uniref:Uncharacterized protein n=1 Tax=Oryzihumus leptocrescens TaxID=297536 RepID=A0A542Z9M7_9MICO|nr:hypothetical protein [Oryzihumus leptocrescens]TQL57057.1 hypothetical protein FB474_3829 [Oryzihumus leptocrescens]
MPRMPRTLTALPRHSLDQHGLTQHVLTHHALPGYVTPGPQHAFGVAEGFGVLVVLFATALGLMILIGHLRHQRRSRD